MAKCDGTINHYLASQTEGDDQIVRLCEVHATDAGFIGENGVEYYVGSAADNVLCDEHSPDNAQELGDFALDPIEDPYSDEKAEAIAAAVRELRPNWSCAADFQATVLVFNIPDETFTITFGNANKTLMGDISFDETGTVEHTLDTGLNADSESYAVLADAIVKSVEEWIQQTNERQSGQ